MNRPYQTKLIEEVHAHWEAGRHSVLMQLGTGGGKTHTAAGLLARAKGPAVFLAHLDALVGDTAARLRGAGEDVGIVAPWAKPEPARRIQVASLGTVWARAHFPKGDTIILDECHRAQASTVKTILSFYEGKRRLGLTATPERGDGQGLGGIFPWMVQGPSVRELMDMGALCGYSLLCPVKGKGDGVKELVRSCRSWTRALFFAETIEAGRVAAHELRERMFRVEEIYGDTPREDREAIRARLRSGETQVLVGVGVFIEGFDEPSVDCVVLSATFGTVGRYLQAIGRGLRPFPGKAGLLILDCVGAVHMHGLPDEGRTWNLFGEASTRTEPGMSISTCVGCHAVYKTGPAACPRCGASATKAETYKRKPTTAERLVALDAIPLEQRRRSYWHAMVKIGMLRRRMPRERAEAWATTEMEKRFQC